MFGKKNLIGVSWQQRACSLSSFYHISDPFDKGCNCQLKDCRYSPLTLKDIYLYEQAGEPCESPHDVFDDPYKCALINMYVLVVFCAGRQDHCTKVSICKPGPDTGRVVPCSDYLVFSAPNKGCRKGIDGLYITTRCHKPVSVVRWWRLTEMCSCQLVRWFGSIFASKSTTATSRWKSINLSESFICCCIFISKE